MYMLRGFRMLPVILLVGALAGCPKFSVPDVSQLTSEADIEAALSEANLRGSVTFTHEYHDAIAAGFVISQDPAAGTRVGASTSITVVVSLGPDPNTIPIPGIHVSNSGSDETGDGSRLLPFATLAHAISFMRDGTSDYLLLERGSKWTESLGHWTLSGLSPSEPMVIGAYGEGVRPLLQTGKGRGIIIFHNDPVNNLLISGLHFQAHTYVGTGGSSGFSSLGLMADVTIDNCFFEGYATGLMVQNFDGPITNFTLRRSIIADSFDVDKHSQGIYCEKVAGLLIEDCLFDHNGWNEDIFGAEPNKFNHNAYIQTDCTNVIFQRNISTRAASHGVQSRPGGTVKDNLFVDDPWALLWGGHDSTVPGVITGNVILESGDIGTLKYGFGIEVQRNAESAFSIDLGNNIVARHTSVGNTGVGLLLSGVTTPLDKLSVHHNKVFKFSSAFDLRQGGTDVQVRNNEFQWSEERALITVDPVSGDGVDIQFSENIYYTELSLAFYMPLPITYLEFVDLVSETTPEFRAIVYDDPDRSMETYMTHLVENEGLTLPDTSFEGFIEEAKKVWGTDANTYFTTEPLLAYFKAGFQHSATNKKE